MSMSFAMLQLNGLDLMISASNDENTYYKLCIRALDLWQYEIIYCSIIK